MRGIGVDDGVGREIDAAARRAPLWIVTPRGVHPADHAIDHPAVEEVHESAAFEHGYERPGRQQLVFLFLEADVDFLVALACAGVALARRERHDGLPVQDEPVVIEGVDQAGRRVVGLPGVHIWTGSRRGRGNGIY